MSWNCTLTEERLSDSLEGLLSREELAAFSAHTAGCADCQKLITTVGPLVQRIQRMEMVEEPAHLSSKILDATLGSRKTKAGWERLAGWATGLLQPRVAVGMATAMTSFMIVLHTVGVTPNKLKKADLSPAGMYRAANAQVHLTYAKGVKFVNDLRVVYEIQSRLQPEPQPAAAPVHEQNPKQETQPPESNPQQKTETQPGHSQVHGGTMLASLLTDSFTRRSR
jgi:predicted anti-sigma-YlaC factor YlaD